MKYKVGMKLNRHAYLTGKECLGQASRLVHTVLENDGKNVKLDTSGWWTLHYMDTCFKPYNLIHIGGE